MDRLELDRCLAEWAREGLLSEAQAAAIREREAAAGGGPARGGAGIPVATEILGYVGGALAVGAIVILMVRWWDDLGTVGRVGLPGIVAVATYAAGVLVGRAGTPSARRLEQFLLLLGVTATGFASGIVVHDACCSQTPTEPETIRAMAWSALTGYAVAALAAAVVYRFRRTTLQHLALGSALGGVCLNVDPLFGGAIPAWLPGVALVVTSLVWGALTVREVLRPVNAGLALASLGVLTGILATGAAGHEGVPRATVVAGLVASIGLLVASFLLRRGVPLGFGAAGVVVFVPWLLSSLFGETIGVPIAVLVTGVLLVATAVAVAFVLPRLRAPRP